MAQQDLPKDALEIAGRWMAQATGRSYETNPMMWQDIGRAAINLLADPLALVTALEPALPELNVVRD